jgi:hypothetical protein
VLRGDQEDARPDGGIAEVVGVARIAPQPGIRDLALVARVGLEPAHLGVADGLEGEAGQPDRDSGPAQPAHRAVLDHPGLHRQGDHEQGHRLRGEDERDGPPARAAPALLQQVGVPRVLALPGRPAADVPGQPQAPGQHAHQEQGAPQRVPAAQLGRGRGHHGGDQAEAQSPQGVDDVVAPGQPGQRESRHGPRQAAGGGPERGPADAGPDRAGHGRPGRPGAAVTRACPRRCPPGP